MVQLQVDIACLLLVGEYGVGWLGVNVDGVGIIET